MLTTEGIIKFITQIFKCRRNSPGYNHYKRDFYNLPNSLTTIKMSITYIRHYTVLFRFSFLRGKESSTQTIACYYDLRFDNVIPKPATFRHFPGIGKDVPLNKEEFLLVTHILTRDVDITDKELVSLSREIILFYI